MWLNHQKRTKPHDWCLLLLALTIAYVTIANIALFVWHNETASSTNGGIESFVVSPRQQQQQQQQQQQNTAFDKGDDNDLLKIKRGELDARPQGLHTCTSYRIRSYGTNSDNDTTVFQNITAFLQSNQYSNNNGGPSLRIGLEFVEDPSTFVSLGKGKFHMFHFLEFLLISFAELHRAFPHHFDLDPHGSNKAFSMAWMYVPLFTRSEICGVGQKGLNCQILELIFGPNIGIYGLDANDPTTVALHPAFNGKMKERDDYHFSQQQKSSLLARVRTLLFGKQKRQPGTSAVVVPLPNLAQRQAIHQEMTDRADIILMVHRPSCKKEQRVNLQKIWTNYVGQFPVDAWHSSVMRGLARVKETTREVQGPIPVKIDTSRIFVCYIDRQSTKRRLPDSYHDWLIQYLAHHPKMSLVHLHMEQFDPMQQIQIASSCQVMLGVHGNGLSHTLWMKPHSFVVEFFWNFPCRYDYATTAQLVDHHYLAIVNGYFLPDFETNILRIQSNADIYQPHSKCEWAGQEKLSKGQKPQRVENGTKALELFLQNAVDELVASS